jgi:hypothetical protein
MFVDHVAAVPQGTGETVLGRFLLGVETEEGLDESKRVIQFLGPMVTADHSGSVPAMTSPVKSGVRGRSFPTAESSFGNSIGGDPTDRPHLRCRADIRHRPIC